MKINLENIKEDLSLIPQLIKEEKLKEIGEFEGYRIYVIDIENKEIFNDVDEQEIMDFGSKIIIVKDTISILNILEIVNFCTSKEPIHRLIDSELSEETKENFKEHEYFYTVSILTIDALRSYKYTDTLNFPSFAFKTRVNSLNFITVLDEYRYLMKEKYFKNIKKILDEIEK